MTTAASRPGDYATGTEYDEEHNGGVTMKGLGTHDAGGDAPRDTDHASGPDGADYDYEDEPDSAKFADGHMDAVYRAASSVQRSLDRVCCFVCMTQKQKTISGFAVVIATIVVSLIVVPVVCYYALPIKLDQHIDVDNIMLKLNHLQDISTQYNNTRDDITGGYMAALQYIQEAISEYPVTISQQNFNYSYSETLPSTTWFKVLQPVELTFSLGVDYETGYNTPSAAAISSSPVVGIRNYGCLDSDWSETVIGAVAILPAGGGCTWLTKSAFASNYGVSLMIGYNSASADSSTPYMPFYGFAPIQDGSAIGGIGVTYSTGIMLLGLLPTLTLDVNIDTRVETVETANLIAETESGNPNSIVLMGAHLDSDGPGINDNGSGSMVMLEIALETLKSRMKPWVENKIIFAWWAAEEKGLLGSQAYIDSLSDEKRAAIACNLNLDMIASPNYITGIYNGSTMPYPANYGSAIITDMFLSYFEDKGLNYQMQDMFGASDHYPFVAAGIPASGLFAGASEIKTTEQRVLFNGIADTPADPCYHEACDTTDNINQDEIKTLAEAYANIFQQLVEHKNLQEFLSPTTTYTSHQHHNPQCSMNTIPFHNHRHHFDCSPTAN
ncbi:M28 family peptidase [Pelomyxa schiedti]|nr:M28 family peptidase [Pelomyxa schiedti]